MPFYCMFPEKEYMYQFLHLLIYDNFQPLLLNDSNNGADWRLHGVKKTQVVNRQIKSNLGSSAVWEYTQSLIEKNVQKGNIKDE